MQARARQPRRLMRILRRIARGVRRRRLRRLVRASIFAVGASLRMPVPPCGAEAPHYFTLLGDRILRAGCRNARPGHSQAACAGVAATRGRPVPQCRASMRSCDLARQQQVTGGTNDGLNQNRHRSIEFLDQCFRLHGAARQRSGSKAGQGRRRRRPRPRGQAEAGQGCGTSNWSDWHEHRADAPPPASVPTQARILRQVSAAGGSGYRPRHR